MGMMPISEGLRDYILRNARVTVFDDSLISEIYAEEERLLHPKVQRNPTGFRNSNRYNSTARLTQARATC